MDAFITYKPKEVDESTLPEVTMEEVSGHCQPDDLWIVIRGKVYDVTAWKDDHPGGDEMFLENGGKDVTELFVNVGHSPDALSIRGNFLVAILKKPQMSKL